MAPKEKMTLWELKTSVNGLVLRRKKVKGGRLPAYLWNKEDDEYLKRMRKRLAYALKR